MRPATAVKYSVAILVLVLVSLYGVTHGVDWLYSLAAGYGSMVFASTAANYILAAFPTKR